MLPIAWDIVLQRPDYAAARAVQHTRFLTETKAGLGRSRLSPLERSEIHKLCDDGLAGNAPVRAVANRLWTYLAVECGRRISQCRMTVLDTEQVVERVRTGELGGDAAFIADIGAVQRGRDPQWWPMADDWVLLENAAGNDFGRDLQFFLQFATPRIRTAVHGEPLSLAPQAGPEYLLMPPLGYIESLYTSLFGPTTFCYDAVPAAREAFVDIHAAGEEVVTLSLNDLAIDHAAARPGPGIVFAAHDIFAHSLYVASKPVAARVLLGAEYYIAQAVPEDLPGLVGGRQDPHLQGMLETLASMAASLDFESTHARAVRWFRPNHRPSCHRALAEHMLEGLHWRAATATVGEAPYFASAIRDWEALAAECAQVLGEKNAVS